MWDLLFQRWVSADSSESRIVRERTLVTDALAALEGLISDPAATISWFLMVSRKVTVLLLLLAMAILNHVQVRNVAAMAPSINVRTFPEAPTPYDNATIQANVTGSVPIQSVTLYYRIGRSTLYGHFNATSEYDYTLLDFTYGPNKENGVWDHTFNRQNNGTVIYFFVVAVDSNGQRSVWADGYPEYKLPHVIDIANPGRSRLYSLVVELNNLILNERQQLANVTVSLGAYMPNFPEKYGMSVQLYSRRYYHSSFPISEGQGARFAYQGRFSTLVELEGNFQNLPYDEYTLFLNLTIPYRIENLADWSRYPIPIYAAGPTIYESWDIPWPEPKSNTTANQTQLFVETTISRHVSPLYPPLVLMLTAFAILGLLPIIARYFPDKRFDLFLNAIILASSAELSQAIYPVGGLLSTNVFVQAFPIVLLSGVLLMAVSSPSDKWREERRGKYKWRWKNSALDHWELVATFLIMSSASVSICVWTGMPTLAKELTFVAGYGGSGIVMSVNAYSWMRSRLESLRERKMT